MLIFVYGADSYSAGKQVEEMRKKFKEKFDPSGMNLAEFTATKSGLDFGPVAQAVTSPPFLGQKRMVIVKDLLGVLKKADVGPWMDLFGGVPESTICIVWDKEKEPAIEKHEIFKKNKGGKDVHAYIHAEMDAMAAQVFARTFVKANGLAIEPGVLQEVVAMAGTDAWSLASELSKLAARANGAPVSREMVQMLVRANADDQMFALMDAVAAKDARKALALLAEERQFGAEDMQLFAMLSRQIRLLCAVRGLLDADGRISKQEVADALGIHPFVAQKTLSQAKSFSSDALQSLEETCFSFDRKMKRGGISMEMAVDRLVVGFIQNPLSA
jgi:DNA polymerase-3 subunit delta